MERVLPILARHFFAATNDSTRIQAWKLEQMKRLAHEIEVIAPACNDGEVREDNSEYPWLDAHDEVQIPCRHNFPKIDDGSREIIEVIRLIRAAAEKYAQ